MNDNRQIIRSKLKLKLIFVYTPIPANVEAAYGIYTEYSKIIISFVYKVINY